MTNNNYYYDVGDRVKIKPYEDIPTESRSKGMARLCGKVGTITDKLFSEFLDEFVYIVHFDDMKIPSKKLWTEDCFWMLVEQPTTYRYEFEFLNDVVIAKFIETKGDTETELGRGHGHMIHEGALGYAQAASYALKKIFEKMNGGTLR